MSRRTVREGTSEPERILFRRQLTGQLATDLARASDRRVSEHLAKFRR